ncbi:hypothetical protein BJ165DRAFT_1513506 [Panaeolus papilionaceus]|nr:hypothetical protein BJ165DRAFT_1513506 [Panaeolus papilionaceus]
MDTNKNETARKKRRLSDDIEQPGTTAGTNEERISVIERGTVWMDDGNIVLQADQTQFRVHKSMLSRCSSVFKDMFSIPQPTDEISEADRGCAVVHLHDSATDVAYLLTAIYNHQYSDNPVHPPFTDINKLSALLRLANKYDIPSIRQNMILRIDAEYPTCFDDYLDRDKYYCLDMDDSYAEIDLVNLLHDEGVFAALPLALYSAVDILTIKDIFNGCERADGTTATLPASMIAVCMVGKGKLEDFMYDFSYKWLRGCVKQSFCHKDACREIFCSVAQRILRPNPNLSYALDLDWDAIMTMGEPRDPDLCTICERAAKKHQQKGRKAVFQQLPSIFGYGSWDEVKKMDRQQL